MDDSEHSEPQTGESVIRRWCMTVDEFNPILHPGERLTRLPSGDYEVTNGQRTWRYPPDEWENLVGDAIEYMDSMKVLQHIRRGVADGSLDRRDLLDFLDDMERRLAAEKELDYASWCHVQECGQLASNAQKRLRPARGDA